MDELSSITHMFESNDLSTSRAKIIRNRLTLSQRIDVLKRYSKTLNIGLLAEEFQCGRRQIRNILRKRKKYMTMWSQNKQQYDDSLKGSNDRNSVYSDAVGFVLHEWIERARCYQVQINDDILRNFAKEISEHIRFRAFEATNDWLKSFKQKYSLVGVNLNIKKECGPNPLVRKPLSIGTIINDLRREYGETAVPMVDPEEQLLLPIEQSPYIGIKVQKKPPKSLISESGDSAMQMDHDDFNEEPTEGQRVDAGFARKIMTYRDALNQLGPLEQFALCNENVRAVGLINQLENIFREEMDKEGFD